MLSARSGALTFVQHSYAGLHSTSGVSEIGRGSGRASAQISVGAAAVQNRCASLSLRPLGRSKKRCLSTATQSLGVLVRCRLRRPLRCQPYPTSFSFGEGACSSPPLRKNERQRPPEQTCWYVLRLAAARYENPLKLAELLIQMARYAFMIIVSDNHAYRSLTPFSPVIRGYICLSCFLSTTTGLVGSAPPHGRSFANKPLPRPPPLKAVGSFFIG